MIAFDIETVPNEELIQSAQWIDYKEKHDIEGDDMAALHPAFAKIVSIVAYDMDSKKNIACASNSEADLCKMLSDFVGDNTNTIFGGHNIKGFDIQMCAIRMMANSISVPRCMRISGKKPWEILHIDTMETMKFCSGRHISLDSMCLILGVESPKNGSVRGDSVWQAYKEGRLDEICQYNKADVKSWIHCYKNLKKAGIL